LQARLDDEIKAKHIVTEVHAEALKHTKDSLKEVETRLRNDMNKGLGNAVKQVESFMRIQSFLGDADSFGDFHGWPISPDIGLFLIDRMREKDYDLIIEFGSGTSTALFARTVQVLSDRASSKEKDIAGLNLPNTDIVTFEHDKLYFTKTQHLLKSRGLEQIVQLVHAPLIDWTEGDQSYLYYDCESTLKSLAVQYADRQAHILVLVDGPPGSTCINARYPAVPCVFKALGRHQIDLVLDDASRPEEKQVIDLWRSFWKKRSFRISESLITSEKGIYLASSHG
jgi:predicted O-methyltransferase YrrM